MDPAGAFIPAWWMNQDRDYGSTVFKNAFMGSEAVDWIIAQVWYASHHVVFGTNTCYRCTERQKLRMLRERQCCNNSWLELASIPVGGADVGILTE